MSGNITLTMIKPDAVRNNHIGGILKMINEAGFRIVAMRYTKLSKENGLPDVSIYTLQEVAGKVYAGTANGLAVISPPGNISMKWKVQTYNQSNGILYENFGERASLFSSTKQFWWSTYSQFNDKFITIMDQPSEDNMVTPIFISGLDIMVTKQKSTTCKIRS